EGRAGTEQVRLVVPATEQGAGFMAAGYARSSGRVGVSLVTSGPGATNSVTPVRDCQADSVPIVLICGQVPRAAMGTDAFQEAPVFNIMAPCAKHVFLVTDERKLEETMRRAFDIARSGRPGPGAVDTTTELSLHMLGMHGTAYANYAVEDCDFLFAVGSRFDDRVAGKVKEFAPNATVAHLDVDASEIGKVKQVDWAHVADVKRGLTQLAKAGAGFKKSFAPWRAHVQRLKAQHPLDYNRASNQIQVEYVLKTLNEITRGEAI